jgi:hypothetical protein
MQVINSAECESASLAIASDRAVRPSPQAWKGLGNWTIHPLVLASYPILALFAQNAREVRSADLVRLLVSVLAATLAVWFMLALATGNVRKGGLIASLALLLFFTSDITAGILSQLLTWLSGYWIRTVIEVNPIFVIMLEALLIAWGAYLLKTKFNDPGRGTAFLNVFAIVLIAMPVAEIISIKTPSTGRPPRAPVPFKLAAPSTAARPPDIYYIILDGYARSDVMKSLFEFDNTAFLQRLEKQGFYIARQSTANYCQTPLSLSASLNAVYLDDLVRGLGPDQTQLTDLIGKSNVLASLRPLGYKFVSFATGFDPTEHPNADVYLSPHPFSSGFERMVIDITPLRLLWPNPRDSNPADMSRQRTVYLLEKLPEVSNDPAPTFVLAHVFCPHPPFVFGENGEDVSKSLVRYTLTGGDRINGRFQDPANFAGAYRAQSAFITQRIVVTIEKILATSPAPPIIILQSDHGSELNLDMTDVNNTDLHERMSILNAYYFPDRKYDGLYSRISPVNSFRVIFNTFFGSNIELMPDRSYFSTWAEPYHFIDVTERVAAPDGPNELSTSSFSIESGGSDDHGVSSDFQD